jgi:hypothetical protein
VAKYILINIQMENIALSAAAVTQNIRRNTNIKALTNIAKIVMEGLAIINAMRLFVMYVN